MDDSQSDNARLRIEAMYRADTAALNLGVELGEAAPGSVVVTLEVDERHLGSLGQLHGGVLFTLADVAMSYASNSQSTAMATHAAIDFVDGAQLGDVLVATAIEQNLRGKVGIYDVAIRSAGDDRLIAAFRGNTLRLS